MKKQPQQGRFSGGAILLLAPALIHIGKNETQQWLPVRLTQPEPSGDQ